MKRNSESFFFSLALLPLPECGFDIRIPGCPPHPATLKNYPIDLQTIGRSTFPERGELPWQNLILHCLAATPASAATPVCHACAKVHHRHPLLGDDVRRVLIRGMVTVGMKNLGLEVAEQGISFIPAPGAEHGIIVADVLREIHRA